MGSNDERYKWLLSDAKPQHAVTLPMYYINVLSVMVLIKSISNIPSPIAMTPEQRQRIYDEKAKRFMESMQKLTEETGLVIVPGLQETEHRRHDHFEDC